MNQIIFNRSERIITSMNKTSLKLYAALILSFNLVATTMHAQDNCAGATKIVYASLPENLGIQAFENIGISLAVIGFLAAFQYIVSDCLIQEEHLVATDYPWAQLWYNDLAKKYPKAHLDTKLFLQSNRGTPAKKTLRNASYNNIFFPEDALFLINYYYEKKLQGQELYEFQKSVLAGQEFLLLREAGDIENKDTMKDYIAFASIAIAAQVTEYILGSCIQDKATSHDSLVNLEKALTKRNFTHNCMWYAKAITIFYGFAYVMKNQRIRADAFACNLADLSALQGGIYLFQNEEEFNSLADIEYKTISPFIEITDPFGKKIQNCVKFYDEERLQMLQDIKESFPAGVYYEADTDDTICQPGPLSRIKMIQDEIDRRLKISEANSEAN